MRVLVPVVLCMISVMTMASDYVIKEKTIYSNQIVSPNRDQKAAFIGTEETEHILTCKQQYTDDTEVYVPCDKIESFFKPKQTLK